MSADPNNQNRNAVHDKHHHRQHKGHRAVGKQLGLKQILVCLIKALFLVLFPTECANRHNAGQHFTGDQIQAVYQLLHDFKFRHRNAGQRADARHHDNNGENNRPAHAGAGLDYHDNAADCDNRRVQHHAQQHDRHHLNLLNIIGGARNQRRCREFFHLCIGKLHDLLVNGSTQIASDFRRGDGCNQADQNRRDCHNHSHEQHFSADGKQIGIAHLIQVNALCLIFCGHIIDGDFRQKGVCHVSHFGKRFIHLRNQLFFGHCAGGHRRFDLLRCSLGLVAAAHLIHRGFRLAQNIVERLTVCIVPQCPNAGYIRLCIRLLHCLCVSIRHKQLQRLQTVRAHGIHHAVCNAALLQADIQDVAGVRRQRQITVRLYDQTANRRKNCQLMLC